MYPFNKFKCQKKRKKKCLYAKFSQCDNRVHFVIVAFVALTATTTVGQTLINQQNVQFSFGGMLPASGFPTSVTAFTCPATAFYFVHYRLLITGNGGPCAMAVSVQGGSSSGRTVSFFTHTCISCLYSNNTNNYTVN